MDDPGPGSLHCVPGGLPGLSSVFRLSSAALPSKGGPQVHLSYELLPRQKSGMFFRFERKLLLMGGTLNITASFLMLTALLVSQHLIYIVV